MNPLSRIGRTVAFLLCLAAACPSASAQSDTVTASASLVDPSVDAGQPAEYHIDVVNGRLDHEPSAPDVPGLTIRYGGESQSQQIDFNNFQMHRKTTTTYVYSIETGKAGRFTIPGQQIEVGNTTLRTLPVTLVVMDAGAAGGGGAGQTLGVELIVPKKSAYIGESIPAEVRAYFGLNVRFQADPDPILQGEGFSVQKFTRPQGDAEVIGGVQVRTAEYKSAIAGVKIGTLTVGPVEVQPVVQMPRPRQRRRSYNDPFSNPFFDDQFNLAPAKQVKLTSDPVTVEIKPLPPGKPADFSGAIGDFKLEAEADPRKAQAGDPVTVRLVLSGHGNFDRIAAPVLKDEHGLRTYPATSKFKADDAVGLGGIKTFEQTIIADGARSSLPSYHFNYLDPDTGKYVALDTPPLAVEIIGGTPLVPTPGATASVAASAPSVTPVPPSPPKSAEDILYIRTDPGPARVAADFLPAYRRRSFWITQGIVGVLALGSAVAAGMLARARNEKTRLLAAIQRQQAELQRALQREDTGRGDFYSAATQWARLETAASAGQPAGSLSVADICRANRLDAHTAGSMEQIFHRHDELAYSGGRSALEPVPAEERRGVLATLETFEQR